jgi:predicted S18 family serine protease
MSNKIFNYYKELPMWAKGVLAIGVVGVSYIFLSQTIKRIRSQANKKTIIGQKNEANALKKSGMLQSYPDSQYEAWADGIQKQFSGCDISMDAFALQDLIASDSGIYIYKIIEQLSNDLDFLKLATAYDSRTYKNCGWFSGDFVGNLTQAVNDELVASEIKQLNKLLTTKQIKYRF